MLFDRVVAVFPAVELYVAEIAFAIVFGVGFGFVEESCARELLAFILASCSMLCV